MDFKTTFLVSATVISSAPLAAAEKAAWWKQLSPVVSIAGSAQQRFTAAQRMAFYNVPALSVAVVDRCRIVEKRAFGVTTTGGKPATPNTRFQAASISKPVAALGALLLVDRRRLSLDGDVRNAIPGWEPSGKGSDGPLNLRQLLSHTGGINVSGFAGYAAGKPVPTIEQILNGRSPANNPPIRIESAPGTQFRYSGGGYTLVQALVAAKTTEDFGPLMQRSVLKPLDMRHSSFAEPRRGNDGDVALGHERDGRAVEGGWNSYPELAAAGLWSTPSDLASFAIAVMRASKGSRGAILSRATAKAMITPQQPGEWGLGFETRQKNSAHWFTHGAQNKGYVSILTGFPARCSGIIAMTNTDGGAGLLREVVRSVSQERDWPETIGARTLRRLLPSEVTPLVGRYSAPGAPTPFEIRSAGDADPDFLIGANKRGRVLADTAGGLVLAGPKLEVIAEIEHETDGALTIVLGERRFIARRVPKEP